MSIWITWAGTQSTALESLAQGQGFCFRNEYHKSMRILDLVLVSYDLKLDSIFVYIFTCKYVISSLIRWPIHQGEDSVILFSYNPNSVQLRSKHIFGN